MRRFTGEVLYGVGSIGNSIVALGGSVIAARFLSPADLGIMQTLLLIPVYFSFFHFGVFNGLNRNIPLYRGRNDPKQTQLIVNSSWLAAKYVSAFGLAVGIFLFFVLIRIEAGSTYLIGYIFVLVALTLEPFSQHLEIVFLGSMQFRQLGVRLLWQNLVSFAASFLPCIAGSVGFTASRVVMTFTRFALRRRQIPMPATGPGTLCEILNLGRTGFPLLIAGALYTFLNVADRTMVAFFLTPADVGHYTLSTLVVTGIQFLPSFLATTTYPRIAAIYGKTGSAAALRPMLWRVLIIGIAAISPASIAIFVSIRPLTEIFLPSYADGILSAEVAAVTSVAFVYFGATSIIAVLRRNTPYIIALTIALGLAWALGWHWTRQSVGILGALWARTIATSLLSAFVIAYSFWLTRSDGDTCDDRKTVTARKALADEQHLP